MTRDDTNFSGWCARRLWKTVAAGLLVVACLAFFAAPAWANSAPPPPVVWFYLDNQSGAAQHLQGAQLLGCDDVDCTKPVLLQTFGVCRSAECLAGITELERQPVRTFNNFTCDDLRCYSSTYSYGHSSFRLILQYPDRARTHTGSFPLPQQYMRTDAWQVAVRPDSLELRATSFQPLPEKSAPPFWLGWVITQMVELGVAALYLGILVPRLARRKAPGSRADGPVTGAQDAGEGSGPPAGEVNDDLAPSAAVPDVIANAERIVAEMAAAQSGQRFLPDNDLLTNLGKIFLINLLTYPAVWFFFPALRHFAADRERTIGWALLLFTWTLAGMLGVFLTLRSRPWRWVAGILTGLAASSGLFCLGIIALSAGYSLRGYQGPGLDLVMILLYAEIYAVLAEALLLLWYSRARIAWYHILALSLLMNLSSFLAGWLFLS